MKIKVIIKYLEAGALRAWKPVQKWLELRIFIKKGEHCTPETNTIVHQLYWNKEILKEGR